MKFPLKMFCAFIVGSWVLWCGIATVSWAAVGRMGMAAWCAALTVMWAFAGYLIARR